jgi:ketosteroid isomerase-like protein
MSQENVEVVRLAFAAWDRGDLEESLVMFDEGVTIHPIIGPTWHGREGFVGMAADWTEGLTEWSIAAKEFIDAGDRVVVRVHQTGRGEASGAAITSDYWFIFTIREGKITRWDMHARKSDAFEAVGLRE